MFGSLRIATIRGIPIRLHVTLLATFAILILKLGALGIPAGILLFGSVLLHELGHSLVAQRCGIRIAGIDLHVMGGMALMTRPPRTWKEEIAIAAAGPLVSLALGFVLTLLSFATTGYALVEPTRVEHLITYTALVNTAMAIFNMIPALPMDGGRIFRALLSAKLGPMRATRVAAWVSRAFAIVFIAVGVVQGAWSLLMIGGLLLLMVGNEERVAEAQEALRVKVLDPFDLSPVPFADAGRETREEFVDSYGRRYVVITRLVER